MSAPAIQRIDVVLREIGPDDFCKDSEKYKGLRFCFKNGQVTKYSYEPNVFSKATGADIDWLQSKVDDCPVCKVGLPFIADSQSKELEQDWSDKLLNFLTDFSDELSRELGVVAPKVKIAKCPTDVHNTCYDRETETIYIHPLDAGPQSVAHEFAHHKNKRLARPDSEAGATAFARAVVTKKFPSTSFPFPTDLNVTGRYIGYQEQVLSMFEMLNRHYDQLTPYLNVSGEALNVAWTPEIVAAMVEMAEEAFIPNKFIQLLVELGTSIGSIATPALMPRNLSNTDKAVLHNIAAHLIMRALKKAPSELNAINFQAKNFGRAVASFDMDSLFRQFGAPGFTRILQDIQVMGSQVARQAQSFGIPFLTSSPKSAGSPPADFTEPIRRLPFNLSVGSKAGD